MSLGLAFPPCLYSLGSQGLLVCGVQHEQHGALHVPSANAKVFAQPSAGLSAIPS